MTFDPARIYLGELFGSDAITLSVQLGTQRSGFTWEVSTDAAWLSLTPIGGSADAALRVAVIGDDLSDGVYTTTIYARLTNTPETIVAAPVTYVRGAVQSLYLPAIVRSAPAE